MVLRELRNTKAKALTRMLSTITNPRLASIPFHSRQKYVMIFLKHLTRDSVIACDEKNGLRFLAEHNEIASQVP
jgi:hypothetical protein